MHFLSIAYNGPVQLKKPATERICFTMMPPAFDSLTPGIDIVLFNADSNR